MPTQEALVLKNADRVANAQHALKPGDVIFVDRASLESPMPGSRLEKRIVDRLCQEFDCVGVKVDKGISVIRLQPRESDAISRAASGG
jgi:hypothetical protein